MFQDRQGVTTKTAIYLVITLVIIVIGSFIAVDHLHKTDTPVASTQSQGSPSGQAGPVGTNAPSTSDCGGAPPFMLNINGQTVQTCSQPADGSVTAVSASSVTVTVNGGSSQTFTISGDTHITHKGQTLSASDIKVGDTVSVISSSSDATQAQYILVNPTFQGAQ